MWVSIEYNCYMIMLVEHFKMCEGIGTQLAGTAIDFPGSVKG